MMASKEAKMIRSKQMSGAAVSMALKPSRGARDDIILAGGKPKDHNKENYKRLKELQKANKLLEEKSPSTPDLSEQPRRHTPVGELPRYLVDRKYEWAEREKERLLALSVERIPKGMIPPRLRKKKADLEARLTEIEDAIDLYSRRNLLYRSADDSASFSFLADEYDRLHC
ncbi:hypothetical protein HK101_012005 [Irineochytrium annulatum]|nr:hypothetical protein HK101_012005 [Irineochytrium annulatum]